MTIVESAGAPAPVRNEPCQLASAPEDTGPGKEGVEGMTEGTLLCVGSGCSSGPDTPAMEGVP